MLPNYGEQQIKNSLFCYGNVYMLRGERGRGRRRGYRHVSQTPTRRGVKKKKGGGTKMIAFGFKHSHNGLFSEAQQMLLKISS